MIKLFYIPLHLLNAWLAYLSPRWVFARTYAPSSETIRNQELTVRNNSRILAYKLKRGSHHGKQD